jgi:hypothetical protein
MRLGSVRATNGARYKLRRAAPVGFALRCPAGAVRVMAGATGAGADVCAALGARVVFNESSAQRWLLCCKAKQATDAVWRPQHDGALLEALRALEALGGLPQGAPAKSDVSWESAEAALKSVKAGLAASWAKPQRGNQHACSPGYDANGLTLTALLARCGGTASSPLCVRAASCACCAKSIA